MPAPRRPAWAEIALGAVVQNYRALAERTGVPVMAVVKADAYGHGAIEVARALEPLAPPFYGVATLGEAAELRDAGISRPIMVFGCLLESEAAAVVECRCVPQITDLGFAQKLSEVSLAAAVRTSVHLKVDTGMGRCGVAAAEAVEAGVLLANLPGLQLEGVMTHFPSSDEAGGADFTRGQVRELLRVVRELGERGVRVRWRHAANSGGVLNYPESWLDMVRPGMSLYGVYPSPECPRSVPLRQAMTLKARIAAVRHFPKGATISYGRTYAAPRDMRAAIVPLGYADGYDRRFSNVGHVLVHGRKAQVVGRVCMDQFLADITDIPQAAVGDEAVLYGAQGGEMLDIGDLAAQIGTIPQVLATAVSKRVPRVYVGL